MRRSTSINSLPDDVLVRIFWYSDAFPPPPSFSLSDYADDGDDSNEEPDPHVSTPPASANVAHVLLIASICRRWRKLAHESVTTLHVLPGRLVSRQDLKRVLTSFLNVTRLHLSDRSMKTIDKYFLAFLGSSRPNLTALHVGKGIAPEEDSEDSEHPVTAAGLDSLFRRCRRLEQLSLQCLHRRTKIPVSFFQLTRLHTLSLRGMSPLDDPNFANLSSLTKLSIQKRDMRLHQMSPLTSLSNLTSLFFLGDSWFLDFEGDFSFGQLTMLRSQGFVRAPTDFPSMFPSTIPCFRLQRLLLTGAQNILLEDLGERFPALRELCLSQSYGLTELPESLSSISTLEALTISNSDMSSLPENLDDLSRLKSLRVLKCWRLPKLPDSIGLLTGLQKLSIDCTSIDILPAAISCLTALESLSITESRLTSIPEEIGELTNLRTLVLSGSRSLQKLPWSLSRLSSLRELSLNHCRNLTGLPECITQLSRLETLKAHNCVKLTSAPRTMGNLSCLRELDLTGCVQLKETIESLPRFLGTLSLGNDTSSIILPDMSTAPNLRKLWLDRVAITDAPASTRCLSQIEHLEMRLGFERTEFPFLPGFLSCLRILHISCAISLQHLPLDIGSMSRLQQLHVGGARSLRVIPESVGQLVQLTSLHIEAANLTHLPESISALSRLGDLSLQNCSSLTSLPRSITRLTNLHRLVARKASLRVLPPNFYHLRRLRELNLRDCERLQSLPTQELRYLTMLRLLDVRGCKLLGPNPVPWFEY